jgi:hypothetical protein
MYNINLFNHKNLVKLNLTRLAYKNVQALYRITLS